ncbi:integrase/recombinase, phage integrase family [Streptococcus pneumoniae]|nr:integrase/recombinase, phage integrase family [Streptococcus pneumoniae]
MQGKLVEQDPNDESVEVLLEKIRAEKQKLFEEGKIKKKDLDISIVSQEYTYDAKNFLAKYNDIALLADLMGHESIETTRIYLRKTATEQQNIVDKIVNW